MTNTGRQVPHGETVVVYQTPRQPEAELLAGALRSAGIGASVIGARIYGGDVGIDQWQIVVHRDVVSDARETIEALETEAEGS